MRGQFDDERFESGSLRAIVYSDFQLSAPGDYLVYTAVEETDGLLDLWTVELGSILFSDGFESGDLSLW